MTEEEALLAAIIAHPDDDTPRLIYADWLQEHGEEETAEFIRVQIAQAGGKNVTGMGETELWERNAALDQKQRDRFAAQAEKALGPERARYIRRLSFHRGFANELTLTSEGIDRLDEIARLTPIDSIELANDALNEGQAASESRPKKSGRLWKSWQTRT